jgi:molybdate transport system ATP-binding protein
MPDAPLIELHQCAVIFGDRVALQPLNFALRRGERWVVTGANGAGKSVLLKLLRGTLWPTPTGKEFRRYCFDGQVQDEPAGIKQRIGFIAPERQDKYVRYGWNLSVMKVVTTGLFDEDIPLSNPKPAQQQRIARLLRKFKLWSLRERRLLELSYGQRRRVLIARLLAGSPEVWLLDEVFNGLDAGMRELLRTLLADTEQAHTWMLAAHSADDIPDSATHLLRLQRGHVVYAGPIKADHAQQIRRDARARHHRAAQQLAQRVAPKPRVLHVTPGAQLIQLGNVELYRQYRPVLKRFDWTIRRGENWAIVGANGSGKSTLLMMLYGDLHPAHGGHIERAGFPKGTPIARWKQHVGYVSPELQADHVWTQTLEELVASGRYASVGLNQPITTADRRAAAPWFKFFGIEALRQRNLRQLSYGELRLGLLARALILKPNLLLLDEPFTGLDPDLQAFARAALNKLALAGTQVIMAIHDPADALPCVSRVLRIGPDGQVVMAAWPH